MRLTDIGENENKAWTVLARVYVMHYIYNARYFLENDALKEEVSQAVEEQCAAFLKKISIFAKTF